MAFVDVAALEDLERRHELRAGELGPALVGIGERRQRAHDVAHHLVVLQNLAVVRFHRPDRQQDMAVHAEPAFDPIEPGLPLTCHLPADSDGILLDAVVEVVPDRRGELGLVACFLENLRIGSGHAAKGAIERFTRDAVAGGHAAEARHPLLETGVGGGRLGREDRRNTDEAERRRSEVLFHLEHRCLRIRCTKSGILPCAG